jgi:hypothetical protein
LTRSLQKGVQHIAALAGGYFHLWGPLSLCHFVLGNNEMELQLNKLAAIFAVHTSRHRCEGLEQGSVLVRNWTAVFMPSLPNLAK